MKFRTIVAIAALLGFAAGTALAETPGPEYRYYPRSYFTKGQLVPACSPLRTDISCETTRRRSPGHAVSLRSPERRWKPIFMTEDELRESRVFDTFPQCIAAAPDYRGRFTDEQLESLSGGHFTAGMPVEFVQLMMGPPDRESYVSRLNTDTGKAESFTTYIWDGSVDAERGQALAGIFGALAFGVAGVSSHPRTSINAARAGVAAATTAAVLADVGRLSRARIVTVEVDAEKRIHFLSIE